MPETPRATAVLARFAAETDWDDIPQSVRHEAKRSILNFLGTALAGCHEDAITIPLRTLAEFSGPGHATILGHTERIDALSAAYLNAGAGNVFDFDDTHLRTVIHPTSPVAPALLSLAELRRVSGRELLAAFILGVEIECRIGAAISPGHYARGWHITSTCGVFGAAIGAGKLLRLDAERMGSALGTAATQSSGLVECLGTPSKSVSVGNAARNGLFSALLAARGFGGPAAPLEGRQGFFAALGEAPNWPDLTSGLGETWELSQNAYKPYPGGIVVHPVIDAVLALREDPTLAPDDIDRILVRGNPLLSQRTDRPNVTTGREAQVSTQHSVAATLLFGKPGLSHYTDECVRHPRVLALRGKVVMEQDPAIPPESAAVRVLTSDGRERAVTIEHARGSTGRPMSDREIEDKALDLGTPVLGEQKVQRLIQSLWSLDESEDASALLAFTVPDAKRDKRLPRENPRPAD